MNFLLDDLIGYKIEAEDGNIGSVHDVLFDDEAWVVRYIVVDTGGWLLGRKVLVAPEAVFEPDEAKKALQVKLTKQQVKDSPEVPVDPPLSREEEAQYRDFYKWPDYWGTTEAFDRNAMVSIAPEAVALGTVAPGVPDVPPIPEADNDPMLRSARTMRGYKIHSGSEDAIGEIADFIVDGQSWSVPFMVAKLDGKDTPDRVLIPARSVVKSGWKDKAIDVEYPGATMRSAPVFDHTVMRDKRFLEGVGTHYDRNIRV